MNNQTLYLALADHGPYGWGICSRYLSDALSKLIEIHPLDPKNLEWKTQSLDGHILHALAGELETRCSARPSSKYKNLAYTFFEGDLTERAIANAQNYDHIFVGSSWCEKLMQNAGIKHGSVLIQGIDHEIFKTNCSVSKQTNKKPFVIFSGSKLEYRKGQDLTIAAMQVIMERYNDVHLVTLWDNYLKESVESMKESEHIVFELDGKDWSDKTKHLCHINGLDSNRVFSLPLTPHHECPLVYQETDLGIFPSRCESGTNLVLMEYMACGKPAIVSNTGGHCDIAHDKNCLLLKDLKDIPITSYYTKPLTATWQEASVDELIGKIDYAYHHRDKLENIATQAAKDMKMFTWNKTAREIKEQLKLG